MQVKLTPVANAFGDRYLDELHQSQFSRQPAAEVLQKQFGDNLRSDKTLYLIIGTDSGLLCEYLLSHPLPERSRYLFIELDDVAQLTHTDNTPDPQVRVARFDTWEEHLAEFHFEEYAFLNRVQIVKSLAALDDFMDLYSEPSWHLEHRARHLQWRFAVSLGTRIFQETQLLNTPDYLQSSEVLRDRYSGQTALILAGGPSLSQHFDWIREHRDQLTILSVSRIAGIMIREQITPDFFVHVDPHLVAFHAARDALRLSEQVPLIAANHAHPLLTGQWQSPVFFSMQRLPWTSSLNEPTLNAAGPTVTNTALASAIDMGFSQILFSGLDLCFDPSGYTHAAGSNESLSGPFFGAQTSRIETYDGRQADTTPDFLTAIDRITVQAEIAADKDVKLINLSGQAAKVANIEYRPLSEIDLPSSQSQRPEYSRCNVDARRQYLNDLRAEIHSHIEHLKQSQHAASQACELSQHLLNDDDLLDTSVQKKLNQLESVIDSLPKHLLDFCKIFGIGEFLADSNHKPAEEWTPEDVRSFGHSHFHAYVNAFDDVLTLLDRVDQKIASRLLELDGPPALAELKKRWSEERVFLRALQWTKEMGAALPEDERQSLCDEMQEGFNSLMTEADAADENRCMKKASPELLRQRAARLFHHHRLPELQTILSFLEHTPREEFHTGYQLLIKGYIAEIEEHFDEALQAYQQIIEAQHMDVVELALLRVLDISTRQNDHPQMLQAMECLALLSPHYLKYYGKFQHTAGDIQGAIESLTSHFEYFPADSDNLITLARIYAQVSHIEAAKTVLNEVLRQYPDNLTAKRLLRDFEQDTP